MREDTKSEETDMQESKPPFTQSANVRDEVRYLRSITTYNLSYVITMTVQSQYMVITLY